MNPFTSTMAATAPDINPEPPSINNEDTKSLPDPCGLFPRVTPTHASLNTEIYPPSAAPMAGAVTPTVAASASKFNPRQPSITNETTKPPTDSFGLFPHVTPMNTSLDTAASAAVTANREDDRARRRPTGPPRPHSGLRPLPEGVAEQRQHP